MIAFDIDNGMTIEQAKTILDSYTYIIYTTSSHKTEKSNGEDRFRILIPTKNSIFVSVEQHKELYENIAQFLGITIFDKSCTNAGRMWYTQDGKRNDKKTK